MLLWLSEIVWVSQRDFCLDLWTNKHVQLLGLTGPMTAFSIIHLVFFGLCFKERLLQVDTSL